MMNKKGISGFILGGATLVAVLLIIFLATGVSAGRVRSLTREADDYSSSRCPDIGVLIAGTVNIEDTGGITLNPGVSTIAIDEVRRLDGQQLCLFCSQAEFTYSIEAIDDVSDRSLDSYKGTGILRSGENEGVDRPFSVKFFIPDLDCDNRMDDFDVKLVAELAGEDVDEQKTYEQLVRFRNGRVET